MDLVKVDLAESLPEVLALHVGDLLFERRGHTGTCGAGVGSSTPRRT
jgi:hypothetical protein